MSNLIPMNERTKDEQREMQKAGGIRSGEVRRKKRETRQTLNTMLESVPDLPQDTIRGLQSMGIKGTGKNHDKYTTDILILASLLKKAMNGDVKACEFVYKLSGDLTENVNVNMVDHKKAMEEVEKYLYSEPVEL